jgi:hypothetical protein
MSPSDSVSPEALERVYRELGATLTMRIVAEAQILKNYISIVRLHVRELLERRRTFRSSPRRFIGALRGQSMVEMIFTVLGVMVVIITAIEGSIILNRGMAVKQLAY